MSTQEYVAVITRNHRITGNTYPVKEQLRALGCVWGSREKCWFAPDEETLAKARGIVQPHPMYNSPPPADLGTAGPVASAAKYGRTAVAGAKIVSFRASGASPVANGTIRRVDGVRYVQLAHTQPRYLSRDWLEDMDMFSLKPGHYYQWDGVAVEATEAESQADATAIREKTEKAAALESAKAGLEGLLAGLVPVKERPAWVSKDMLVCTWPEPVMIHTGAFPTLHYHAETRALCYYVPGYFACDWDYEPVIKVGTTDKDVAAVLATAAKQGLVKMV